MQDLSCVKSMVKYYKRHGCKQFNWGNVVSNVFEENHSDLDIKCAEIEYAIGIFRGIFIEFWNVSSTKSTHTREPHD